MGDVSVIIKEDGESAQKITFEHVHSSFYKINHPNASPDRLFHRGEDLINLVTSGMIYLNTRKV